jgi:hypothetical protein
MSAKNPGAAPVENPHHVHPTRMRHISDADLASAVGCPGADAGAIRARLARRPGSRPVWDPAAQARALLPAGRESQLAAARGLLDRQVDFVAPQAGRSGLYGLHYLRELRPLVLAYELTRDESFAACFDRIFATWHGSRDLVAGDWPGLDVIWYSLGVGTRAQTIVPALASFAASASLTDATWADMLKTIVGGARWSAEEHSEFRHGNWQVVCAAELLHVAAYLPEAAEAAGWAARGRARLVEHLEQDFYDDGGHYERSPGYHALCLEALQRAAVVAEQQLGWRLDDHPRFRPAHDWLAAMTAPAGWVPAWQDSGTEYPGLLLLRGHYFHPDPAAASLVRRWLSDAEIRAELAVLPARPGRRDPVAEFFARPAPADPGEVRPCSQLLPESGYAVLRGPAPAEAFMAVNLGPYVEHDLESHSHLAVTDFVMSAYGAPLALEAGGPPSYDDPRYQDWYRAPDAHNAMTLPGQAMRTDRRCTVDLFADAGPVTVLHAHHHGYAQRIDRRIVFVADPAYWLISDRAGGVPATWSILGPAPWLPDGPGFRSAGFPCAHVVAAGADLPAAAEAGPGQVPGDARARHGELHALRLGSSHGRFDVLLAPSPDAGARWRLEPVPGGWRVSNGTIFDTVLADRWERRSPGGAVVAAATWTIPEPGAGRPRDPRRLP